LAWCAGVEEPDAARAASDHFPLVVELATT
jgi:endonuclease/exonuclease/phosphatase family metal-dependent hydrolase